MKQVLVQLMSNEVEATKVADGSVIFGYGDDEDNQKAGVSLYIEDGKISYKVLPTVKLPEGLETEATAWISDQIKKYVTLEAWNIQPWNKTDTRAPLYGLDPEKDPEKWLNALQELFPCTAYKEQDTFLTILRNK